MEENVGICILCGEPIKKSGAGRTEDGDLVHDDCYELAMRDWEENNEYKDLMGY